MKQQHAMVWKTARKMCAIRKGTKRQFMNFPHTSPTSADVMHKLQQKPTDGGWGAIKITREHISQLESDFSHLHWSTDQSHDEYFAEFCHQMKKV